MQPRRSSHTSSFALPPDAVPADFATRVVSWQQSHGRHGLPWQGTRDAYRIWLSEIMLQQTQVSAVLGYYTRFLERFPTVESLAAAPSDDVMAAWAGLGYYTRARNLHRCAQIVVAEHRGQFPRDPERLAALPGIGRSTAAAIAAFSAGARAAILDGNVKRVFARVFGIEGFPGDKRVEDVMWRYAETALPERGIEAYTQGLMDLGAMVCVRGRPVCLGTPTACPLHDICQARAAGTTDRIPAPRPRKVLPERAATVLVLIHQQSVLLERRPEQGIWGGLWSLPEIAAGPADEDAHPVAEGQARRAARAYGEPGGALPGASLSHTFTHFRLQIHARCFAMAATHATPSAQGAATHAQWHAFDALSSVGLPAPIRTLIEGLLRPSLL
jgi:A/G-specific adenine glycosylase